MNTKELTRHDLLKTWGYLEALRIILSNKIKDAEEYNNDIRDIMIADYTNQITEITVMQNKIIHTTDTMPGY